MRQTYAVAQGNRHTGFGEPSWFYNTLEEFIDRFNLVDRQCIFEVQEALITQGFFIFSDYNCPVDFKLYTL